MASSLTRGCNEIEKNSWCFGISEKEMKIYGMYGLIVSGSGLIITLIVFVIAFAVHKRKNSSSIEELIN